MTNQPYWISSLIFSFSSAITSRLSSDRTLSYHFLEQAPASWTDNKSGFTPFTTATDNRASLVDLSRSGAKPWRSIVCGIQMTQD